MTYLDDTAALIRAELGPEHECEPGLLRLYALLAQVKGEDVTFEDVHDAWAVWTQGHRPDHRCIVPFDDLDAATQALDEPFVEAIRRAARKLPVRDISTIYGLGTWDVEITDAGTRQGRVVDELMAMGMDRFDAEDYAAGVVIGDLAQEHAEGIAGRLRGAGATVKVTDVMAEQQTEG